MSWISRRLSSLQKTYLRRVWNAQKVALFTNYLPEKSLECPECGLVYKRHTLKCLKGCLFFIKAWPEKSLECPEGCLDYKSLTWEDSWMSRSLSGLQNTDLRRILNVQKFVWCTQYPEGCLAYKRLTWEDSRMSRRWPCYKAWPEKILVCPEVCLVYKIFTCKESWMSRKLSCLRKTDLRSVLNIQKLVWCTQYWP